MPEMVTRTRTSPGPGSASGMSPISRTSVAGPGRSYQAARIGAHYPRRNPGPPQEGEQFLLSIRGRTLRVAVDRPALRGKGHLAVLDHPHTAPHVIAALTPADVLADRPTGRQRLGCCRHSFGARLCPSRSGLRLRQEVWIMSGSRRKPGPLGPFLDGYRAWLVGRGYSPSVVVRSLVTLGHLGRWLERNALAVDQLTAEAVSSFLAEYRVDRGRLPGASVWPAA